MAFNLQEVQSQNAATPLSSPLGPLERLPTIAFKRILVPLDFSDCSRKALDYAIALASQLQAELLLLHAFRPVPPDLKILESVFADLSFREQAVGELAAWHSIVPSQLQAKAVFREGRSACREILNVAAQHHVDLIVLGRHRRRGLERVLMGSTAEQVVKHAHCTVMIAAPNEGSGRGL